MSRGEAGTRRLDPTRVVTVAIPGLRLTNPLNGSHRHWRGPARERKRVRTRVALALLAAGGARCKLALPLVVTITRVGPGTMDTDGLAAACKPARDSVAKYVGADDGDAGFTWVVAQRKEGRGVYAVEIRIEARGDSAGESARETSTSLDGVNTLAASRTRPRRTAATRKGRAR